MFTIHFQKFINDLHISEPEHDIPLDSPVFIFFEQKGDISKHEILRRFNKTLSENKIYYLRPLKNLTSEWVVDLQEMKSHLKSLSNVVYLKGKFTLEPEVFNDKIWDEVDEEMIVQKTILKFSFYKDEVELNSIFSPTYSLIPDDIRTSTDRFFKDLNKNETTAFLMMKFEDSGIQTNIVEVIKTIFLKYNIKVLRADDKWYSDDLFTNIKTYMHCCSFGIGLFERVKSDYFNPNVSLEIGYMLAMNKPVLLLKDDTLKSLHSDLVTKLYYTFDYQNPEKHLEYSIERWLKDKEII